MPQVPTISTVDASRGPNPASNDPPWMTSIPSPLLLLHFLCFFSILGICARPCGLMSIHPVTMHSLCSSALRVGNDGPMIYSEGTAGSSPGGYSASLWRSSGIA